MAFPDHLLLCQLAWLTDSRVRLRRGGEAQTGTEVTPQMQTPLAHVDNLDGVRHRVLFGHVT